MQNNLQTARTANFHDLFVTNIVKILATRSQILRLECIKFDFGWGSAQTPLGELTAFSRPSSWI